MLNQTSPQALYQALEHELQQANITLVIARKRVKHINFRLKPNHLAVSAPYYASDIEVIDAISRRLDWALDQHAILLNKIANQAQHPHRPFQDGLGSLMLWGAEQPFVMGEKEQINWYRNELQAVMPLLFDKWQPIVGKTANETRIKKMKTRWGSCNTKARRIWLSVYLPAYPIECTEYVIVHELCHLHHANHSAAFWHEVKKAMPEYRRWHDLLAGKSGQLD